ncbi:crossover junction endodeoxyribonuclease RuvC [bacterium]|nr:crossover junction endodeoxyribonuclease RuvC [bacterium]
MKVLGVDPGYGRLGVAVLEHMNGGEKLLYSSCIETHKSTKLPDRLYELGTAFEKILKEHNPDAVALETLFFNKNQKTAVGVLQARGLLVYLAKQHNCHVFEYGPQEIKIAVTGYGKSDKGAVIDMVKRIVSDAPESALDDEYDAIAVGVTCLAHERNFKV